MRFHFYRKERKGGAKAAKDIKKRYVPSVIKK